jgi:hypothetical protein
MYQHTPGASKGNDFCWDNGVRSIFSTDTSFTPKGKQGKTKSQISTEIVDDYFKATGKSRGTIKGISKQAERVLADRWGGAHSKGGKV